MKDEIVDFFSELALRHTGIVLGKKKAYLIKGRLDEVSKSLGLNGIDELYKTARYKLNKNILEQIIDALTTNETFFFRDNLQFEALKKHVIPELIQKNEHQKRLRIWSAASSTGQEAYSIAILIREHFPQLSKWHVEIIGSDISKRVIEYAKEGAFSQIEVNRGLPARLLVKYFRQKGNRWIIDKKIKDMVRFLVVNLKTNFSSLGKFDLIFCRYVLIYFSDNLKKQVLMNLRNSLSPGGYIFFGATELSHPPGLTKKILDGATCYQLQQL